jgi:8-oxo-dGTP diphosphatase
MQTVTAAILAKDGKILIARRPASSRLANKWEFPGGKVEGGETPEACLTRELKEELDIEVSIGAFLGESVYHYRHGSIRLLAYQTYWDTGEIDVKDHDEIKWVSLAELDCYEFTPADVPFVRQLQNGAITVT